MLPAVLAAASLLCGLAVGAASNLLLAERLGPAAAPDGAAATPLLPRPLSAGAALRRRLIHPLLLGAASLALSRLPGLAEPIRLSQALLLLYLLYPLALIDLATLTIEPALIVGGVALRAAVVLGFQRGEAAEMLGGLLGGAGLLALVGFAYRWLRDREGLGEGDAAVLGLIGAFVGWQGLLPVVLLATAGGVLAGVPTLLLLRKPLNTPLPFAPFLCGGGLAVFLAQSQGYALFGMLPRLG